MAGQPGNNVLYTQGTNSLCPTPALERRCIYRSAPHETDESNVTNEENKPERKTGSDLSETQTWHLNPEPRLLTSIATAVESGSLTGRGDLSFLATFYNEDSKAPLPKEV